MSEKVLHVGKKSIVAYIRSAVATFIWLMIFGGGTFAAAFGGAPLFAVIGVGACLLIAAKGVYNLVYLKTVRWVLTEEGVRVTSGLLPWRKTSFNNPYETIFESFYEFGFFAKLFGYGTVTLRRTEGLTTAQSFLMMDAPGKITNRINGKLKELRQAQKPAVAAPPVVVQTARSEVQELAELVKLKAAGDISAEDFELMKNKILGRQALHAAPPTDPTRESDRFAS